MGMADRQSDDLGRAQSIRIGEPHRCAFTLSAWHRISRAYLPSLQGRPPDECSKRPLDLLDLLSLLDFDPPNLTDVQAPHST